MPERRLFPEWSLYNRQNQYPFTNEDTLTDGIGNVLPIGLFYDAALYPIGAGAGLYLSTIVIDFQTVTLTLAAPNQAALATATFSLIDPPALISFTDTYGRPAGVLLGQPIEMAVFQTWGVGTFTFMQAATLFEATCVFPTPEVGVRGIELPTGEVFTGDVWLVGTDGVVFTASANRLPVPGTSQVLSVAEIRMDVVGDPLFRRRLCTPEDLFQTPRFLKQITVIGPNMTFTALPDANGNIRLTTLNDLAGDSVLRIATTETGIQVAAVGEVLGGLNG